MLLLGEGCAAAGCVLFVGCCLLFGGCRSCRREKRGHEFTRVQQGDQYKICRLTAMKREQQQRVKRVSTFESAARQHTTSHLWRACSLPCPCLSCCCFAMAASCVPAQSLPAAGQPCVTNCTLQTVQKGGVRTLDTHKRCECSRAKAAERTVLPVNCTGT